MSNHTITIDELIKNGYDFGLKDYPIFDEAYRETLNNAILSYYRYREIGFIFPDMFKDRLNTRMTIIMRNRYNDLYKAKKTEFNLLYNVEMHETYTRTSKNEGTTTQNQTDHGTDVTSGVQKNNTLQTSYPSDSLLDENLESVEFANSGTINKNTDDTTLTNNRTVVGINDIDTTNTETFEHDTLGSSAGLSFSHAMQQFIAYIDEYNLDGQVINELKDLFMNIW